jgi:hypothetical protein
MVLQSSGVIKLSDIRTEFGGTGSILFSNYYTNNASGFTSGISGLPASGTTVKLSQFYGKSKSAPSPNVKFTNSNAYFYNSANAVAPSGQGLTLSFWVKIVSTPAYASNFYILTFTQNSAGTMPGLQVFIDFQGRLWVDIYQYNSSALAELSTSTFLNDGAWHHVLLTVSSAGQITLYLDGVQNAQGANSALSINNNNSVCKKFYVNLNTGNDGIVGSLGQLFIDFKYSSNVTSSNFNRGGVAVNIGSTGSNVFNATPLIYMKDSGTSFMTNYGFFGAFNGGNLVNVTSDSNTFMIGN